MSCEESYIAIRRYLTDEREPYAPGTHGNTKRKIRKAAACYVVRSGVLYYQRRQKGQDEFTELEVVLQAERRKELVVEAHVAPGGEHLNQHQTWEAISQKYWWRGILKEVKDFIRECSLCQGRQDRGRGLAEDDTEDDKDENTPICRKSRNSRGADKHKLVVVDSKGVVKQFLPKHGQTILDKLNQQRLNNQFCDITLLIEGEEHRAHKAVLAACSDYFYDLFIEKGAVSSHEAVIDLSGFSKACVLPLVEFAYTSRLTFNFGVMAELVTLARHLLMVEVLEICESVHRQVEEQKLTVYQRADTVPSQTLSQEAPAEQQEAYADAVQTIGEALVTHAREDGTIQPLAVISQPGGDGDSETIALVTQAGQVEAGESLTVVAHSAQASEDGTMTVITHSGQAGSGESLAVVQACWTVDEPQAGDAPVPESVEPGAFLVSVDPGTTAPSEVPHVPVEQKGSGPVSDPEPEPQPSSAPGPPKRKRGRPAKVKQEVVPVEKAPEEVVPEQSATALDEISQEVQQGGSGDRYRRCLRQRSMGEGSYVRLHMGLEHEEEEQNRAAEGAVRVNDGALSSDQEGLVEKPQGQAESESAVDGEHACNECGMVFQRRYALIMHTLKHEKARGFKCSLCNKEFQYATSLRAHLTRHKHQKAQRAAMARPSAEDGHDGSGKMKVRAKREFVCDICGKTLPKLYSLRIHMLNHTGVRPHACRVCGKTFAHKHSLKMHRALHDAAKQFHCTLCDKSFVSKRSLEEHTSVHTGESKYLCTTCGKSFHRASGLSKHLKAHQPKPEVRAFQCAYCDKSFYEAKDLQQHMNKHLGLKPFQCQVCGKCYSWKKDWYSHVKSHTIAEPFRCNICGKEFFEKALFRRHVKKATHGKKGRVKQNLERECEHCGRKFTQLREYRRHVNNHQGVKPFECLTCGVAWADARSLKRHVRTHTGERPYVCPVCQEAHIDARTLRKHMTKFHSDYLPGKIMLEKDTLQFHNQGTQVEHAVSILAPDLPPELQPAQAASGEETVETVLITEETVETMEAVQAVTEGANVTTLSDQSIMQVVNYVLAQQAGLPTAVKMDNSPEVLQTMEVEVAHVAEVE
uniref:Zinc finger and BTB domain-containing protein 11 n=1 Tax=Denticeps clupeoides TaxID=299321 RepID=A0AAY4CTH3_9TELE